jgi:hypothetical protein
MRSDSCEAMRLAVISGQGNLDGADTVPCERWCGHQHVPYPHCYFL